MLLHNLSGFTYQIMKEQVVLYYSFSPLLSLAFIIAFSDLEIAISIIQAQVFIILTCSYIKDGLDLH